MRITTIAIVAERKRTTLNITRSQRAYPNFDPGDELLAYFDVDAAPGIKLTGCLLVGTESGSVRMQTPRGKDGNVIVALADTMHQEIAEMAHSAWRALTSNE
jgi:hypothetical protein